jgi:hypothetical protein
MFLVFPVVIVILLVFFGYCALWSSYQGNIPKGVSQFGRILSLILFVIAGLVIVFGLTFKSFPREQMRGEMGFSGMPSMQGPSMQGHSRQSYMERKDMNRRAPFAEKEQMGKFPKEDVKKAESK